LECCQVLQGEGLLWLIRRKQIAKYERISPPGDILYFVNGLGGKSKYNFLDDVVGSQVKYNEDYGAMLVDVSLGKLRFQFINRQEEMIDDFSLVKPIEYLYIPILQQTSP
jgi:hypothetical protein